jgi:hypothetical protein
MTNQDLHTRAMLVSLRISAWSARKYDKKISLEVAANHGASADAGRYNKYLMPADATSYKALEKHIASHSAPVTMNRPCRGQMRGGESSRLRTTPRTLTSSGRIRTRTKHC